MPNRRIKVPERKGKLRLSREDHVPGNQQKGINAIEQGQSPTLEARKALERFSLCEKGRAFGNVPESEMLPASELNSRMLKVLSNSK